MSCGDADAVTNGTLVSYNPDKTYTAVVTFECDPGFEHIGGDLVRTCNTSALWSGTVAVCSSELIVIIVSRVLIIMASWV